MHFRNPHPQTHRRRSYSVFATLLIAFATYSGSASAQYYPGPIPPPAPPPPAPAPPAGPSTFVMTPLVSNGAVMGTQSDLALINPWGIALAPDSAMWVANNATQTSTVYDGAGTKQLTVNLPGGTNGLPRATGLVFNGTTDFLLSNGVASESAKFIFAGEAGTLLAWAPTIDAANAILTYDDGAGGAVYKGLAIATDGTTNFLYATDFHNSKVDVFNSAFQKITAPGGFADPLLPPGYAPFGIQALPRGMASVIYVAYALRAADPIVDGESRGAGLGLVNVFDTQGVLLQRLIPVGGNLNAPWGMVLAPATFGSLSNLVLIGNFGDGVINAYDPNTGAFVDSVKDASSLPIANAGLWGLAFGNGTNAQPATALYFAAGIAEEAAGLYGRIDLRQ